MLQKKLPRIILTTCALALVLFVSAAQISAACFQREPATPRSTASPVATSAVEEVTQTQLDTFKQKLEQAQLDAAQSQSAASSIAVAEANVKRILANRKAIEATAELHASAENRAHQIKTELAKLSAAKNDSPRVSPEKLSPAAKAAEAALDTARTELRNQQNATALQNEQSTKAAQLLAELAQQRDAVDGLLREVAPAAENPLVNEAKKLELLSKSQWLETEINRIRSETELSDANQKSGLLNATIELLTLKVKHAKEISETLEGQLATQRQQETIQAVSDAEKEAQNAPAVLRPFADENAEIAELATGILEPAKKAKAELKSETKRLEQLQKQFTATENRVNAVGLTASVGAYLRNRKTEIPREGWLTSVSAERISEIEHSQSQQFDLKEKDQTLLADDVVTAILATAKTKQPNITEAEIEFLRSATLKMVQRRRELLKQAIDNHKDYLDTLTKLRNTEKLLSEKTSKFHEYINERILWIRSNDVLFSTFGKDKSDANLYSTTSWIETGKLALKDITSHLIFYIFSGVLFAVLFLYRIRMRLAIKAHAVQVVRGSHTDFMPTVKTLFLTLAIAVVFPLLLMTIGWRIASIVPTTPLTNALGKAFSHAAWFFFVGEFLRQVCRKDGLAEKHFGWTPTTVSKLKNELGWFVPLGAILSFTCSLLYFIDINHGIDFIERIVFLVALGLLTCFLYKILHPVTGIFREQIAQNPKAWLVQSKSIWFWGIFLIPMTLIVMVIVGYYYSAMQMLSRIFSTAVTIMALEIGRSLLAKFIQLSRRKARIEQSKARLQAQSTSTGEVNLQAAELQRAADQEAFLAEASATIDENVIRSKKLVAAAIAIAWVISISVIWADLFPALRGLDKYVLWTAPVAVVAEGGQSPAAPSMNPPSQTASKSESKADPKTEGDTSINSVEAANQAVAVVAQPDHVPVTLRHLLIAIFILVVSIFAVRNLPAFLELMFLKHLPVEQSVRHAVKAITGYLILLVGVVIAGRAMYIGWSQIQWLATALTFGLAFGLQEIFANFVAGIILLLERPIRIGDVISVDDVTGTVSKIRIRATTITDLDKKDYIVPNKEFVTGRVLNWTLSDKINRMAVRVGVAYGTDVRKAKQIIKEICENHPMVVDTPPTIITFEEFGDSSLNLTARVFLRDYDSRWPALDEINLAINDAFRAGGIEISFPQRDLHIRTASPEFEDSVRKSIVSNGRNGNANTHHAPTSELRDELKHGSDND